MFSLEELQFIREALGSNGIAVPIPRAKLAASLWDHLTAEIAALEKAPKEAPQDTTK